MQSTDVEGLRSLYDRAKRMPILSERDISFALSCLHISPESRFLPAPSYASLEQLHAYMVHLCDVLPQVLGVLGNPTNWKVTRLLNPETGTLRRPKIYLKASINEHRSLYVSWGLVPTIPHEYFTGPPESLLEASDFKQIKATWNRSGAPGYTIVRLTSKEYPASAYRRSTSNPDLIEEDRAQREAFQAFLAAMVGSLRQVLDVEIDEWVEYDESGCLQTVSVVERVRRLAREQHQASMNVLAMLTQQYEQTLQRAGVTASELEQVLAVESNQRLADVFAATIGRKIHATELKACVLAHEPIRPVRELEAHCRQVLHEAEAER